MNKQESVKSRDEDLKKIKLPELVQTRSAKSIKVIQIVEEELGADYDWDHLKLEELKEMQRLEELEEQDIREASEDGDRKGHFEEISSRSVEPKKSIML